MPTSMLRATLTGTLALAAALLLPGANAQTTPTPDTPPAPTAPAPDGTTPTLPTTTEPGTTPEPVTPTVPPMDTPASQPTTTSGDDNGNEHRSHRFRFGPEVGIYLPTNSRTRDRFGNTWYSLGLGLGPIEQVASKGQLAFDFALQYQQHSGNHVLLIPLGIGYRVALTKDPAARTVPYAGVTGDLYLADVRSQQDNIGSGLKTGAGGSAVLGVNFGDSGNLQARYQFVSHIQSFDFSGLSLTAGFRF